MELHGWADNSHSGVISIGRNEQWFDAITDNNNLYIAYYQSIYSGQQYILTMKYTKTTNTETN